MGEKQKFVVPSAPLLLPFTQNSGTWKLLEMCTASERCCCCLYFWALEWTKRLTPSSLQHCCQKCKIHYSHDRWREGRYFKGEMCSQSYVHAVRGKEQSLNRKKVPFPGVIRSLCVPYVQSDLLDRRRGTTEMKNFCYFFFFEYNWRSEIGTRPSIGIHTTRKEILSMKKED